MDGVQVNLSNLSTNCPKQAKDIVPDFDSPSIVVLLTCYNRVKETIKCLDVVFRQTASDGLNITVILVDDGSTDATSEVVKEKYPQVQVLMGDGNLFWNRGMHLAFGEALEKGFDYYFWLNDDTLLYDGAICRMLGDHRELSKSGYVKSIVVASTRDPVNGEFTYGGYKRNGSLNPLSLCLVPPSDTLQRCDTFCGNCVLIPRQVADRVGNVDPEYQHRWGDVDYGLRALEQDCYVWIAPGFLAECEANPLADRWLDPALSVATRIAELNSVKGLGKHDWPRCVRRHGGPLWPVIWAWPYLKFFYEFFTCRFKALISRKTRE